jgi:heme-degrading monooxygenase HmoA
MAVTVLVRRRARPGMGDALVALALAQVQARIGERSAGRQVRLFQGLNDPDEMLRVVDWPNREVHSAFLASARPGDALDALCVGPPERHFFRRLSLYEDMSRASRLATCTLAQAAPGRAGELLAFFRHVGGPAVRALPGVTLRCLYESEDVPGRYLVLVGWATPEDWETARREVMPRLRAQLVAVSSVAMEFVGRTYADIDRAAPPGWHRPGPPTGPAAAS